MALPVSAITLTYDVSPHPFSYQTLFEMLLAKFASQNMPVPQKTASDMVNLILGLVVVGSVDQKQALERQSSFQCFFSRQLETKNSMHPSCKVFMSVTCGLMSNGVAHRGLLFATTHGLYFRSGAASIARSLALNVCNEWGILQKDPCSNAALELKVELPFSDIVSLLPSVALATMDDKAPIISGIPNPVVIPNALQVFTVNPPQIYQFVYLSKVVVAPPSVNNQPSLLNRHEYNVICAFPRGLDAVTFSALSERLWEARLTELRLPLLRDGVRYAEPH